MEVGFLSFSFFDWVKPREIRRTVYGADCCKVCTARTLCTSYGQGNKMVLFAPVGRPDDEGTWLQADGAACRVYETYCRKAGDTALREWEEQRAAGKKEALTLDAAWTAAGIPYDHRKCELENFRPETDGQKAALDAITDICVAKKLCAIMLGSNGTGKTHLAVCVLKAWGGKYYTEQTLYEKWRINAGYTGKSAAMRADLEGLPALVIDEAGKSTDADFLRFLYNVLDARCGRCKPWVLCGNTTAESLMTKYTPALFSRAAGYGAVVMIQGRDGRISA